MTEAVEEKRDGYWYWQNRYDVGCPFCGADSHSVKVKRRFNYLGLGTPPAHWSGCSWHCRVCGKMFVWSESLRQLIDLRELFREVEFNLTPQQIKRAQGWSPVAAVILTALRPQTARVAERALIEAFPIDSAGDAGGKMSRTQKRHEMKRMCPRCRKRDALRRFHRAHYGCMGPTFHQHYWYCKFCAFDGVIEVWY